MPARRLNDVNARTGVLTILAAATLLLGCSTPVVKEAAWDPRVAARLAPGIAEENASGPVVPVDPALMSVSDEELRRGVYVGLETGNGPRYGRLMACDPAGETLSIRLLPPGVDPLAAVTGAAGSDAGETVTLPIDDALRGGLSCPIPTPRRVYAVAANFPSHLEHDLAIEASENVRKSLAAARPRVFLKHPPVPPPDGRPDARRGDAAVAGPFAPMSAPRRVALPAEDGQAGPAPTAEIRLDYEVEIGVVFGRRLTPEELPSLGDDDLRAAVAGYVLVSDSKARNPQVVRKVAAHGRGHPESTRNHGTGDEDLDAALGPWDETTCAWWSHAAGLGTTTAIGPYFAAAAPGAPLPARPLASARSYAAAGVRRSPPPGGPSEGTLHLRQASVCTTDRAHPDALYWDVPAIVRSILATDGVLRVAGTPPVIEPGDVLCLGTPGGTVITARSQGLFEFLAFFMSTWTPFDWHDLMFEDDAGLYLLPGDRLLLWAENLGVQLHEIRIEDPPAP